MKKEVTEFALYGGKKVFDTFRTTTNMVPPNADIFFKYAKRSFDERQLTNSGSNLRQLENELANFHEVKHCICVSSGFSALMLVVKRLALNNKKEVVIPSLAYRSTADIIEWAGYVPHFCDVDYETRTVTVDTLLKCINENTALIVVPHPMVTLANIDELEAFAKEVHIPLVFDSVEAFGATYKGKKLGGYGLAEIFSMHASKVLNACEGGYITTNDDELAKDLKKMRSFGFCARDKVDILGFNMKLNEFHAAMALSGLHMLEEQLAFNKALFKEYQRLLSSIPGIEVIPYSETEKRNWKTCLVKLTDKWKLSQELTLKLLNAENINARPYYFPLLHKKYITNNDDYSKLFNSEKLSNEYMILPFGYSMKLEDVPLIAETLLSIYNLSEEILKQDIKNEKNS